MKKQLAIFSILISSILFFVCSTTIAKASENSILTAHWDFNEGSGNSDSLFLTTGEIYSPLT